MHDGPRANYDKELRAQGIGNLLAGLLDEARPWLGSATVTDAQLMRWRYAAPTR